MTKELTRDTVTVASRVMLPVYPVLYGAVGLAFVFQAVSRTAGPAFEVPRMLLPITVWGWLFAAVAVVEIYALVTNQRRTYLAALVPGSGLAAFWSVVILSSAVQSEHVSFTSGLWVAGMAAAQAASARSLAQHEVT